MKRAPRPRTAPDAALRVGWAAADEVSLALDAPLSVPVADSVLSELEPDAVVVPVTMAAEEPVVTEAPLAAPPMTTVVEVPTETAKEETEVELPTAMTRVVTPTGRPAGTIATAG